jgi:putative salt-induced outer membrane protein
VTDFLSGATDSRLAALLGLDFDWRMTDRLTLTQDSDLVAEAGGEAVAIVDSRNTSVNFVTGLEAKVSDRLTTRLSYAVEYDSDPPPGAVKTDTLSRFTLVYGF